MSIVESSYAHLIVGGDTDREAHHNRLSTMIQALSPQQNLKHREVCVMLTRSEQLLVRLAHTPVRHAKQFIGKCLKIRPSTLALCVSCGTQNWEPRPGLSYLNNVAYLAWLWTHTPARNDDGEAGAENDGADESQVREQISSWIPKGKLSVLLVC